MIDRVGNYVGSTTQNESLDDQEEEIGIPVNLMESDFIKRREREIIEAIAETLDPKQLNEVFEREFNLKINGSAKFINGKIIVFDNFAVYKLNLEAQVRFYLLMDRAGNYLALADADDFSEQSDEINNDNPLDFSLSM